jgi:hypothetical protein
VSALPDVAYGDLLAHERNELHASDALLAVRQRDARRRAAWITESAPNEEAAPERTDTMKMRMLMLGIGALVGVLGTAGVRIGAQQNLKTTPSVLSPQGFLVEEVRVGGSCALVVSTTGSGPRQIAALPCGR